MNVNFRRLIAALVVIGLAELLPEVVNWTLVLILVGMVLGHFVKFEGLVQLIGNITGDTYK